ncbi:MAG: STAS domain-containing protein [Planctomycetota bacterium]|jgi:anti-anti-sigma regulatory factor|nr:STAS domain-containing protein [Planctomycetota bacterium]
MDGKDEDGLFTLKNGVVRAKGDMYWEYLDEFEAACAKLLAMRRKCLKVDLSEVNFVSSAFFGAFGSLTLKAIRRKKKIIVRMTTDLIWLVDIMGMRQVVELEIV